MTKLHALIENNTGYDWGAARAETAAEACEIVCVEQVGAAACTSPVTPSRTSTRHLDGPDGSLIHIPCSHALPGLL